PGSITGVESSQEVPAGFVLEQNYPNPFNPTTTIKYNIPKAAYVTLKVYDILGNVVQTLINKEQQSGMHEVQFTVGSRRLASGVYFYKLQAGSFVSTKKMILLR
ncbi:MAG: T9SS type A sorting domain-containing protein, partial [Ignavibacteriaceae bacterium]